MCRSSGQRVKAWCAENGISTQTYYRWERKLLSGAGEQRKPVTHGRFAELPNISASETDLAVAVIRVGGMECEIRGGISEAILTQLVRAMSEHVVVLIKATATYLTPVYELPKARLLQEDILHADETTLQVLNEPGREAGQKSYMWLYRTGREAKTPIVIYEYQQTRKAENPKRFLAGFTGYIHADGYAGYHDLSKGITVVGCWAYARRKFDEALNVVTPADRASSKVMQGKRYCDRLFAVEDKLNALAPEDRTGKRKELAEQILSEFQAWLNSVHPAPKSAFGRAVAYALEQWPYLTNYLLDGRLEISNNLAERSIKPFVMGRKNFLFANTPGRATTSAVIYSLIETGKESALDPYRYLTWLMTAASSMDMADAAQVVTLLPENAPDDCRTRGN